MKDTFITDVKQIYFFANEIIFDNIFCNNILVCVLFLIFKLANVLSYLTLFAQSAVIIMDQSTRSA